MGERRVRPREVWRAPAKINLWLEILGRREDGYHRVDTAYQAIDLADTVTLEPWPGVICRVTGDAVEGVPEGRGNLAARAARTLAEHVGRDPRVAIEIEKRIPSGAGLGGGSSDAAAVLVALARRYAVPDPEHTLHEIAESLGADVPFFLQGGTRRGRGTGTVLSPIAPPAERWGILLWPGTPVSTVEAYREWDAANPGADGAADEPDPTGDGATNWTRRRNDLEGPVRERWPAVDRGLEILAAGAAAGVRMSGSGSAVFALYAEAGVRDAELPRVEAAAGELAGARVWPFALSDEGVEPLGPAGQAGAGPSR